MVTKKPDDAPEEYPAQDLSQTVPAMSIPDVAEPMLGFRSWVWDRKRRMLKSVSMVNNYWPPRLDQHALCNRGKHETAQESCTCGVYAAYNIGYAAPYTGVGNVFGLVWGFGENVVPADDGFRAQFGRIACFLAVVPEVSIEHGRLRRLAAEYGVPVLDDDVSVITEDYRPLLSGRDPVDDELRDLLRKEGDGQ